MPPTSASPLHTVPLSEIIVLLIKQFRRLLAEQGLLLTTEQMDAVGAERSQHPLTPQIVNSMAQLVAESEIDLQTRFGFTFEQALATAMDKIGNWETTAEFLELANHKSNAELRISAGVSLMALLGDGRYAHHLQSVIADDEGRMDVDAIIAQRALDSL